MLLEPSGRMREFELLPLTRLLRRAFDLWLRGINLIFSIDGGIQ
jgi:hypothetical protein